MQLIPLEINLTVPKLWQEVYIVKRLNLKKNALWKAHTSLHRKWSFPLGISPVNVTKSAVRKFTRKHLKWSPLQERTAALLKQNPLQVFLWSLLEHAFYRTPSGDWLEIVVNSFCLQEANSRQRPFLFNKWTVESCETKFQEKNPEKLHIGFIETFIPWLFSVAGCKLAAK